MFESTQQNVENQEKSDDDSQNLLGRPEPKLQFHEWTGKWADCFADGLADNKVACDVIL